MRLRNVLMGIAAAAFGLPLAWFGFERLVSDAATRLAYQIRNEALWMRAAGETIRVFTYSPTGWPDGVAGAYRIEITEGNNAPRPGHRSIGVARNLTERTWYATSYHLNYVEVPADLEVRHQAGEATVVTLEARDGKILLTRLE